MPYTLKPNKIYARDNNGRSYLPQNVITDRTTAEDIELWRTATADIKADANAAVSQARADVDQIAASVASMVDLGTDTTLSTSRMAADAKATGDAVSDLKSAISSNPFVATKFHVSANTNHPSSMHQVSFKVYAGSRYRLYVGFNQKRTYRIKTFYSDGTDSLSAFNRDVYDNEITASKDTIAIGIEVVNAGDYVGNDSDFVVIVSQNPYGNELATYALRANRDYVTANNAGTVLPDADNASANTMYMLFGNNLSTAHLPINSFGNVGLLYTFKEDLLKTQVLLYDKALYKRTGYDSSWNAWDTVTFSEAHTFTEIKQTYVTNSNSSIVLPDANDAQTNTLYMLFGNNLSTAHLPINNLGKVGLLYTYKAELLKCQILLYDNTVYKRSGFDDSWNDWNVAAKNRESIRVGQNQRFTKLTDALEYAYDNGDCDVYVDSGTYDIFSELGGTEYFNSFVFSDTEKGGGPVVGNGCNYFFSPGAIVTFYNTTDSVDVCKTFSPFNAGNGNFTINGLVVRCSKCRYAFHDEMTHGGLNNRKTVDHIFRNVNFYKDNSENSVFDNHYVIGGGLISHGGETVTIENSFFGNAVENQVLVSYHNGLGGSNLPSKSKVSITGCYFDNGGTARIASYGDNGSEEIDKTVMFVTNCHLGSAPIANKIGSGADNVLLYQWNNEIT